MDFLFDIFLVSFRTLEMLGLVTGEPANLLLLVAGYLDTVRPASLHAPSK